MDGGDGGVTVNVLNATELHTKNGQDSELQVCIFYHNYKNKKRKTIIILLYAAFTFILLIRSSNHFHMLFLTSIFLFNMNIFIKNQNGTFTKIKFTSRKITKQFHLLLRGILKVLHIPNNLNRGNNH